jgi:EAL domain-containing protein (putative c-di-GMP-specific phosphodiesterase class I)
MTVAEARAAWPDKVLWCNFPSSVHLSDDATIAQTTRQMLAEAAPADRFLIGVTEDIPETHLWRSLGVIAGVLNGT